MGKILKDNKRLDEYKIVNGSKMALIVRKSSGTAAPAKEVVEPEAAQVPLEIPATPPMPSMETPPPTPFQPNMGEFAANTTAPTGNAAATVTSTTEQNVTAPTTGGDGGAGAAIPNFESMGDSYN